MSLKARQIEARRLALLYVGEGNPHKPSSLQILSSRAVDGGVCVEVRVIVTIPDRLLPARRAAPAPEAPPDAICGARPRRGDGTLWCTLPPGHAGLHAGDGMAFSARTPRERVTAGGAVAASSPRRRAAIPTPPVCLEPAAWPCDRRDCRNLAVAVIRCHRRGCHADYARCAAHGGADGVTRSWLAHARQMAHEHAVPGPPARIPDSGMSNASPPGPLAPLARECSTCGYAPCMCDQQ